MLRLIFASVLLLLGVAQSLRGPFFALVLYLGIAYFRPEAWIWTYELKQIPISYMAGLYAVGSTILFRERFRFGAAVWLMMAFCVHGLIGTLLSPDYWWCFFWWKGFAKVTIIAILIVGLVSTRERMRLTFLVIVLALGFDGVKQGWAYLLALTNEVNLNPILILGDNNGVAVGMLMVAAIVLALLQTTSRKWLKPVYAFMFVGIVYRGLTSYSRGGFLAFGAMCFMYLIRSKNRLRGALLVAGLVLLVSQLPGRYWNRMNTITAENITDTSVHGRLYFWQVAQRMANQNPLLGVGTSGFQVAYDRYDQTDGAYGRSKAVHSMWFGTLAEQGYLGLLMLCTIFLMALRAAGRARNAARKAADSELFAFATALQTALVVVAVGGTFLSYHYVEIFWHFLGLSFAVERIALRVPVVEVAAVPVMSRGHQPAFGTS